MKITKVKNTCSLDRSSQYEKNQAAQTTINIYTSRLPHLTIVNYRHFNTLGETDRVGKTISS